MPGSARFPPCKKHIGNYGKTRDVFIQYKQSGYSRKFYAQHEGDLILHQAAKKHFNSLGLKKPPMMNMLKQEYATLAAEKKKLYQGYRAAKDEMAELLRAKSNVDRILGEPRQPSKTYERDAL